MDKSCRRRKRADSNSERMYRQNSIGLVKEIYFPHNGLGFRRGQISLPTLPFLYLLHRSSLTFISRVFGIPILRGLSGHPCVTMEIRSSHPEGWLRNAIPLPFLLLREAGRRLARLLSEAISAIKHRPFHVRAALHVCYRNRTFTDWQANIITR